MLQFTHKKVIDVKSFWRFFVKLCSEGERSVEDAIVSKIFQKLQFQLYEQRVERWTIN